MNSRKILVSERFSACMEAMDLFNMVPKVFGGSFESKRVENRFLSKKQRTLFFQPLAGE